MMLVSLILAALLSVAPGVTVYDATDDCSATGAIEFRGLGDGVVGFVVPDGTLYFDDGLYPIAPGAYTVTVERPGTETFVILDFVIHDCTPAKPATHRVQAPKPVPTMPPTDTE